MALSVTSATAAHLLEIGESAFLRMVESGEMPPARSVNGRKRWIVSEIETMLLELPIHGQPRTQNDEWNVSSMI